MPTLDIRTDYFEMVNNNFTGTSYLKNGSAMLGSNNRDAAFVGETLIQTDMSGIPAGSTIDAVEVKFTIDSNSFGGASFALSVHENDKGAAVDNGSTVPSYDIRAGVSFWSTSGWPASVSSFDSLITPASSGVQTASTTAGVEALVQDMLDAVKPQDGFILQGDTGFFSWFINVSTIEVNVTFTAPILSRMIIT